MIALSTWEKSVGKKEDSENIKNPAESYTAKTNLMIGIPSIDLHSSEL